MNFKLLFKTVLTYLCFVLIIVVGIYLIIDLFENEPIIFTPTSVQTEESYPSNNWMNLDTIVDKDSIRVKSL